MKKLNLLTMSVLSVAFLSQCISYPSGNLASRDLTQVTLGKETRIFYSVEFLTSGQKNDLALAFTRNAFDSSLRKTKLFTEVGEAKMGQTPKGLLVHFQLNNTGDQSLAIVSGFISGLTLTILPGYARDEYTMTATIMKDGKELKQYIYNQGAITTWIQILLVFAMPFADTPSNALQTTIDDFTNNFIADAHNDKYL